MMTAFHFHSPVTWHGVTSVCLRNLLHFRQRWLVTAFWTVLEPALYLFAIGMGVGRYVGQIEGQSYSVWFFPGLVATTAMFVPFFEGTYGTYTKMIPQRTFSAALTAPISTSDVGFGEILWAVMKGLLAVLAVGAVGALFGQCGWSFLMAIPVLVLICFVFAAIGVLITSFASHYDTFIYAQSGFVIPLSLFSGTYFPLSEAPAAIQLGAFLFPLSHGVSALRMILLGQVSWLLAFHVLYLIAAGSILTYIAILRTERRLLSL